MKVILLIFFSYSLVIAKTKVPKVVSPKVTTVEVLHGTMPKMEYLPRKEDPQLIGVKTTFWSPKKINIDSRVNDTQEFKNVFNGFGFEFNPKSFFISQNKIFFILGASGFKFERKGQLNFSFISKEDTQNLFLFPIEIGLDLEPKALTYKKLSGLISLRLNPTWVSIDSSMMSDAKSFWTAFYETQIGARYNFDQIFIFDLKLTRSFGSDKNFDFNNFGMQFGVKKAL